ncbi:hypothetical protein [Roseiconus lacunae]|uniref:Chromosome partition protein Smc n=1 Tax=Roseiconus lacunae TaxID=2605694 RepID=A0ABT7PM11_9BACT|nr:hypothetical protein [Roseiconus lacunae]MDM4017549.1 hypothetical protein [Roseiconus lacunae]
MSYQDWTETDIQSLKAQEAKDLAVELLHALDTKEQGPISPGEVQMLELEFELKLRQAEKEDAQQQREHERELRQLELELEKYRAQTAESNSAADAVRQELKDVVDRIRSSEESLAINLERSTREHRLKLERLEHEFGEQREQLQGEVEQLTARRDELVEQIQRLTDIEVNVEALAEVEATIASKQATFDQQTQQLDDEVAALHFQRTKRVKEVEQTQELELARLKHEYNKHVLLLERETADRILEGLGLSAIEQGRLDSMQAELDALRAKGDQAVEVAESEARERFRREFNISGSEPFDVTALQYRQQAAADQVTRLERRIEQLETEVTEARQHIQGEPQRIATAVEAARTPIQNIVEPASKR